MTASTEGSEIAFPSPGRTPSAPKGKMTAESRTDLKLPKQLTLALKLLAETEGRLSLMEETLRCITGAARLVSEARRERLGKMADMKERMVSLRGNINRREAEALTKDASQTDDQTTG